MSADIASNPNIIINNNSNSISSNAMEEKVEDANDGSNSLAAEMLFLIGDRVNLIYACIGSILELLLLILFCFLIKTKKSWNFKGFSILLSVGYCVDLIAQFCWVMTLMPGEPSPLWINATQISFIYAVASAGIWNVFLSLNRCTAVLWPMKHSTVWSIKMICLYCIPILLYPCAIQGHIIFDERFYVEGMGLQSSKTDFLLVNRLILGISNTVMSIIMLAGTIAVYAKYHKKNSSSSNRWEIKMLLNCAFSSFFMVVFSVLFLLAAIFNNSILQFFAIGCEYLSLFMWNTFHYGSIVMLLIVNKPVRKSFLHFYTFGKYQETATPTSSNLINPSSSFTAFSRPTITINRPQSFSRSRTFHQ